MRRLLSSGSRTQRSLQACHLLLLSTITELVYIYFSLYLLHIITFYYLNSECGYETRWGNWIETHNTIMCRDKCRAEGRLGGHCVNRVCTCIRGFSAAAAWFQEILDVKYGIPNILCKTINKKDFQVFKSDISWNIELDDAWILEKEICFNFKCCKKLQPLCINFIFPFLIGNTSSIAH